MEAVAGLVVAMAGPVRGVTRGRGCGGICGGTCGGGHGKTHREPSSNNCSQRNPDVILK